MKGSVADELRWRLGLYRDIFAFCRQGGFSFARFLALVPDRLRLSVGESLSKLQIPVSLSGRFLEQCADLLPKGADGSGGAPAMPPDLVRRAIRLAQIDGDLDLLSICNWVVSGADPFLNAVGRIYLKGLGEVGHGEGGEETAYLVHLLIIQSFRRGLDGREAQGGGAGQRALASAMLPLALQGLLSTNALPAEALSARLGFQFAVSNSPLALGASQQALVGRPGSSYRTSPDAVELVRAKLRGSPENLDSQACVEEVANQMLARPATRAGLARQLLQELVRDCLLVLVLEARSGDRSRLSELACQLAGSSEQLQSCLATAPKRGQLIDRIDAHPNPRKQPLPMLRRLLDAGERMLLGGTVGLYRHGDLRERAELAAVGALLFVFDQQAETLLREVISRVQFLPAAKQQEAYQSGRSYRIDFDAQPLYQLRKERQEAQLFVDLKDFTRRTAAIKEEAMGDFLKRYFYDPIFTLAARLKGNSAHALSVSNILGDAVAFRGEIEAIIALAVGIRRILTEAEEELGRGISEVLGGNASELPEIDEVIAETEATLAAVAASPPGADDSVPLADRRKRLAAKLQMLRESREQKVGQKVGLGMEAGAYIAFGAAAEMLELSHPSLGQWPVAISERLNEAARGTARSLHVKAEREAALAKARLDRHSPSLELPFQVRIGRKYLLDLPVPMAEPLEAGIYRGDRTAATNSVRELARWLLQATSEAIERREMRLPESISVVEELYNGGCAIAAPALEAFEQGGQRFLSFQKLELYRSQLPEEFHQRYLLEYDPERLMMVRHAVGGQLLYLFRYSGRAMFRGFEKLGGVDLWELLLPDSAFGRDLQRALGDAPLEPMAERSAKPAAPAGSKQWAR